MTTDDAWGASASKISTSGDGAAFGLASLGLGATTLLAAAITMTFNGVLFLWHSVAIRDFPKAAAMVTAFLCVLMMLGLACCGVVFGRTGRRIDRDQSRQSPLATGGVLHSAAATLSWIIVGVDLILILSEF
jgi:apolipoprotein N-acyltransferase